MLTTVIGAYPKPNYLKITDWFNAKGGTDTANPTKLYNDEIRKMGNDADKIFKKELFIDMAKEMLIDAHGNPGDIKEIVTKQKITHKYYYLPRKTQQYTTVFQLEVTLENDLVVGWKDLP